MLNIPHERTRTVAERFNTCNTALWAVAITAQRAVLHNTVLQKLLKT